LTEAPNTEATFEPVTGEHARVSGLLEFATVAALLPLGSAAIREGRAAVIDLARVAGSDSAGLALLIEWLSVAREAGRSLRYENIPSQIHQLADLSDVLPLIAGA
jgi:phospholipid transport system transporter-binding protein